MTGPSSTKSECQTLLDQIYQEPQGAGLTLGRTRQLGKCLEAHQITWEQFEKATAWLAG